MTIKELPSQLRELAEMIEKGKVSFADKEIVLGSISSFKLLFKYEDYNDIVKTRMVIEIPNEDKTKSDKFQHKTVFIKKKEKKKSPIKKLQKRMFEQFEKIQKKLKNDTIPDKGDVESFNEDCETMILSPGRGDEYVDDFLKSVKLLVEASDNNNMKDAKSAMERILYIREELKRLHNIEIC